MDSLLLKFNKFNIQESNIKVLFFNNYTQSQAHGFMIENEIIQTN